MDAVIRANSQILQPTLAPPEAGECTQRRPARRWPVYLSLLLATGLSLAMWAGIFWLAMAII
jgi:hypothetical protein